MFRQLERDLTGDFLHHQSVRYHAADEASAGQIVADDCPGAFLTPSVLLGVQPLNQRAGDLPPGQ